MYQYKFAAKLHKKNENLTFFVEKLLVIRKKYTKTKKLSYGFGFLCIFF